jgi:hypothetical protein
MNPFAAGEFLDHPAGDFERADEHLLDRLPSLFCGDCMFNPAGCLRFSFRHNVPPFFPYHTTAQKEQPRTAALFAGERLFLFLFERVAHRRCAALRDVFVHAFANFPDFGGEILVCMGIDFNQDRIRVATAAFGPILTVAYRTTYLWHPHALLSKWGSPIVSLNRSEAHMTRFAYQKKLTALPRKNTTTDAW